MEAEGLAARAGAFVLRDVSFTLPAGGYGVVVGPAGSGKTTLLETIAGVARASGGRLRLGGEDALALPPERRGVALVYQHSLLFPHLTVAANVAYGAADATAAREAAELVGADSLGARSVDRLSGGERQLVALARALARRPRVLLLDEPYAALDPASRERVRQAVRALHRSRGTTVLQVTHDFAEAGLLGDLALVLDAGRLAQRGTPDDVFRRPATPEVARFLGAENVLAGEVRVAPGPFGARGVADVEFRAGGLVLRSATPRPAGAAHAVVRAEDVALAPARAVAGVPDDGALLGTVTDVVPFGAITRVGLDVRGTRLVAAVTARDARALGVGEGVVLSATVEPEAVHLC